MLTHFCTVYLKDAGEEPPQQYTDYDTTDLDEEIMS